MTFDRFLALLTFLVAALPLGAIALVVLLYGAVASWAARRPRRRRCSSATSGGSIAG